MNIMLILMKRDNPHRNEVLLVQLSSVSGQTLEDFIRTVLKQATDPLLRSQRYINICTSDGVKLENKTKLKQYFPPVQKDLYHVMIATPHGNTCNEAFILAQPILMDKGRGYLHLTN